MPIFEIPIIFSKTGTYKIKAKNLGEAINKIYDPSIGLPKEEEYLGDSLQLDYDRIEELNEPFAELPEFFAFMEKNQKNTPHIKNIDKWTLLRKLSELIDDPITVMKNLTEKGQEFDKFIIAKIK